MSVESIPDFKSFTGEPDFSGPMRKRGGFNTAAKERHFVLYGRYLFYFKSAKDLKKAEKVPLGAIDLVGASVVRNDQGKNKYGIRISGPKCKRDFELLVDKDEACEKWFQVLGDNARNATLAEAGSPRKAESSSLSSSSPKIEPAPAPAPAPAAKSHTKSVFFSALSLRRSESTNSTASATSTASTKSEIVQSPATPAATPVETPSSEVDSDNKSTETKAATTPTPTATATTTTSTTTPATSATSSANTTPRDTTSPREADQTTEEEEEDKEEQDSDNDVPDVKPELEKNKSETPAESAAATTTTTATATITTTENGVAESEDEEEEEDDIIRRDTVYCRPARSQSVSKRPGINFARTLDTWDLIEDIKTRAPTAKYCFFEDQPMYGAFISKLCTALRANPSISAMVIRSCYIEDTAPSQLSAVLSSHPLPIFGLSDVVISDEGVRDIAEMLRHNTTMHTLLLDNNQILSGGASELFKALKTNKTLKILSIDDNMIDDVAAGKLASSLQENSSLTVVTLEGNQISPDGVLKIAEAIENNTTIKYINLDNQDGADPDPEVEKKIFAAIQRQLAVPGSSLEEFIVKGVNIVAELKNPKTTTDVVVEASSSTTATTTTTTTTTTDDPVEAVAG